MELQDYKNMIAALLKKHKAELSAIHLQYADSNNPYKIGDVVKDHSVTIRVERIRYTLGGGQVPYCLYTGVVLKKDGTPNVRGKEETIYQTNIII